MDEPLPSRIWAALNTVIFTAAGTSFTPMKLVVMTASVALLFVITSRVRTWVVSRASRGGKVEPGVAHAVATIGRYVALVLGILVIVESAGIDLSAVLVFGGALGVGVGLALQGAIKNFVSGLILLVERPIKVGDRIEVGATLGSVRTIGVRATTVITNDNVAVIVPNDELISTRIVNWSYEDADVRISVPVGVAYGTDLTRAKTALIAVAKAHPGVLASPEPDVLLRQFADSSLELVLRVWTREFTSRPDVLRSELNFAICAAFREHGVVIPFPQRDVHVHLPTSQA